MVDNWLEDPHSKPVDEVEQVVSDYFLNRKLYLLITGSTIYDNEHTITVWGCSWDRTQAYNEQYEVTKRIILDKYQTSLSREQWARAKNALAPQVLEIDPNCTEPVTINIRQLAINNKWR